MIMCFLSASLVITQVAESSEVKVGSVTDVITSVPRTMFYQGILNDSGGDPVTDSVYSVTFRIFNVASGGTSLWDEILPCTTSAGFFAATFSNVNLSFDEDYWLELEIGGEILDPRLKLNMVGYAARADTSDYAKFADSTDAITDGEVDFADIGQNGATNNQIIKWNGTAWIPSADETGGIGWNWSDSSSHGPDSVLFADSSNHADLSSYADASGYSDSTDAITDGAVDFADIGQNGAAPDQVMKWNGTAWAPAADETGGIGWNWSDSSSHGPDSVLYSDTASLALDVPNDLITSAKVLDGSILTSDLGDVGALDGEVIKWDDISSIWITGQDDVGSEWNWSDSSSHGPDSVLFADSSNHADLSSYADASGYADSTDAITDGAVDFADLGQNGAAADQIIKWTGTVWAASDDESGAGWVDDGNVIRLDNANDSVGIGTTTPTEKLDVTGSIHASGTITSGSSITIDGNNSKITSTGGYIDFDNEFLITTGRATIGPDNQNSGTNAFVAGESDTASGAGSVVSGGLSNKASAGYSNVGGGNNNEATNLGATVSGGIGNFATGSVAAIGGGNNNTASGTDATVPGGLANWAAGDYSFAAGRRAKANHDGAFVWADITDADFASTVQNQFAIRAGGGLLVASDSGLSIDIGNDGDVDAEFEGTLGPSANLALSDNDSLKSRLWGKDYGQLQLYDGDGNITADLNATSGSGGILYLDQEDGTAGMQLSGGTTSNGATLTMRRTDGTATISLDADLTGNDAAVLPSDAISKSEILDEPGVASNTSNTTVFLDGTVQTLLSRSMYTSFSGYILVIATAEVYVSHSNGTTSGANFGVSDAAGSFPDNQDVRLSVSSGVSSGSWYHPVTVHGLFFVSSGSKTFYFLGEELSANFSARDLQLTLAFFPTAYGTVVPTVADGMNIPDDKAPQGRSLTAVDIAAEQAEAIAFHNARIERELEQMRAERAKLEARLQKLETEVRRNREN
jgi:hypothetical protein